jgi:hypothetical protein
MKIEDILKNYKPILAQTMLEYKLMAEQRIRNMIYYVVYKTGEKE